MYGIAFAVKNTLLYIFHITCHLKFAEKDNLKCHQLGNVGLVGMVREKTARSYFSRGGVDCFLQRSGLDV